jgi:Spy/CpxP family protein refolding chaperone
MARKSTTITKLAARLSATAVALGLTLGAGMTLAAGPGGPGGGGRRSGAMLRRALHQLDLTNDQKDKIHAIFDAERPTFRSLRDQMKTDRQALKAAADANAGATAVGNAFLKVRSDGQAIRAEMDKVKTQVEALLTPSQKTQLDDFINQMKASHGAQNGS